MNATDANGDRLDLPWQIRNGMVVSGSFETEREKLMADEVNASATRCIVRHSMNDYRQGREDGRALYEPRNAFLRWLVLMFDGGPVCIEVPERQRPRRRC